MSGARGPDVGIYNPLHQVLGHFVERLTGTLEAGGISTVLLPSPNGEVGGRRIAKAVALRDHLVNVRRHVNTGGTNIVAWPLLGWWEVPLWRHATHASLIVLHDPEPLVRQHGLSPRSARSAARISGSQWPHIVVMSPEAHEVAAKYFDHERIHLVPHPMKAPDIAKPLANGRTVLVLGQHKPARDLEVMAAVSESLQARGWIPVVAGRGWPEIAGWRVINKFLTEDEFRGLLASAAVVLLPYRYYFQSGVALRALETGVPVVGRETGFLASILGSDFAGRVDDWDDPKSWLEAVEAAVQAREDQISAASAYSTRGAADWRSLISRSVV